MRTPPLTQTAGRMSLRTAGVLTIALLGLLALPISSAQAMAAVQPRPGSNPTIGMGNKTCTPAPGANCTNVKHRWGFEYHGDLTGVNFTKAHLHGAKLHDATLKKANFSKAKLHRAKFHRANLNGGVFDGAGLRGAEFHGAKLKNASFVKANLKGADFGGVQRFGFASRSAADDCKANPSTACSNVTLDGVDFSGANLAGANFSDALLVNVKFTGANLEGANFQRAQHTSSLFMNANLRGANFDFGDLSGWTNFNGADLTNARLTNVITGADSQIDGAPLFRGATLDGALMSWSWLSGSDFTNAHAHNVLMQSSYIVKSIVAGSDWSGSNFSGTCAWGIDTGSSVTMDLAGAITSNVWPWDGPTEDCATYERAP